MTEKKEKTRNRYIGIYRYIGVGKNKKKEEWEHSQKRIIGYM